MKHRSEIPVNSFKFENLPPATELSVIINSVCVIDNLQSASEEAKIHFITLPLPPRSLELESRLRKFKDCAHCGLGLILIQTVLTLVLAL
jgi:hypothetical protein